MQNNVSVIILVSLKQEALEEQMIQSSARKEEKQWEIAYPWEKDPDPNLLRKPLSQPQTTAESDQEIRNRNFTKKRQSTCQLKNQS